MSYNKPEINNYKDGVDKLFRFPYFNSSFELKKIKLEQEELKQKKRNALDLKNHNIATGKNVIFDQTAFNKMVDTVIKIGIDQRALKDKMKLIKFGSKSRILKMKKEKEIKSVLLLLSRKLYY